MKPQSSNEVDKFFENLPSEDKKEADIFEKPVTPTPEQGDKKEDVVLEKEEHKNRRHRRLEAQLQQEREARIAAEARAEGRSEADRFSKGTTTDESEKMLLTMYGDTKEGRQAADIHKALLERTLSQAKKEALEEIEQRQIESQKQEREYESFIDSELEAIEDDFNVDVTSNSPSARKTRNEFIELIQKLSPKDEDGNITSYADFGATFEMYQAKQQKPDNSRNREVAARSMEKSGGAASQGKKITAGFNGWREDYGL